MIKYCVGFMFSRDFNDVLLIRKNKPEWQKGLLNGIGGKLEEYDLSMKDCMAREFLEETGIHYLNWEPFVTLKRDGVYEVHFFKAISDLVYGAKQTESEVPELICFAELMLNKTIYNLQWLIPLALDECTKFPIVIKDINGN